MFISWQRVESLMVVWANDRIEVEMEFLLINSREICGDHVGNITPPNPFGFCLIASRVVRDVG